MLALLVSIYRSKEVFIDEYRSVLASRLLAFTDAAFSIEREIATIELLKIRWRFKLYYIIIYCIHENKLTCRFGEETLHRCEVMLRDTEDSRRLSHKIQIDISSRVDGVHTEALMVSSHYWPSLSDDGEHSDSMLSFLHPLVLDILEKFSGQYHELKKPRKLKYYPHLGMIDFSVDFNDGTNKDFRVNPILVRSC